MDKKIGEIVSVMVLIFVGALFIVGIANNNGSSSGMTGYVATCPLCDDGNFCTNDVCLMGTTCTNMVANEGSACTTSGGLSGTCQSGTCSTTQPKECFLASSVSECTGSKKVIIKLSSPVNAHGATSSGSYGTIVCCGKSGLIAGSTSADCGTSNENAILFLSGTTNAHAELKATGAKIYVYNSDGAGGEWEMYPTPRCACDTTYEEDNCASAIATEADRTVCKDITLSGIDSNGQRWWKMNIYQVKVESQVYTTPICASGTGIKFNTISSGSCSGDTPYTLLSLSGRTNSHLAYGDGASYPVKICTSLKMEAVVPVTEACTTWTTRDVCWTKLDATGESCSWTPTDKKLTTTSGHCCNADEKYNHELGRCEGTDVGTTCNAIWKSSPFDTSSVQKQNPSGDVSKANPYKKYCSKVASSYGYWDTPQTY
jgi:hypothetical protein